MEKTKNYEATKFSSRVLRKAISICTSLSTSNKQDLAECSTSIGNERWKFDDLEEFLISYGSDIHSASLTFWWDSTDIKLSVVIIQGNTIVSVKAKSRASIEAVFASFEEAAVEDKQHITAVESEEIVKIFIGHGRNPQWEKLKAHLQDKHSLNVVAYETGARAGHAIRDVLDSMSSEASIALLVLTGEDKSDDGIRARQNVIHECGLFQGTLGFDRAILIVEEGIELASNFDGIQQLRFKRGRISEVFGDVLATIRREFGPV